MLHVLFIAIVALASFLLYAYPLLRSFATYIPIDILFP